MSKGEKSKHSKMGFPKPLLWRLNRIEGNLTSNSRLENKKWFKKYFIKKKKSLLLLAHFLLYCWHLL